jgi:hypothetical protein
MEDQANYFVLEVRLVSVVPDEVLWKKLDALGVHVENIIMGDLGDLKLKHAEEDRHTELRRQGGMPPL